MNSQSVKSLHHYWRNKLRYTPTTNEKASKFNRLMI